MADNSIRITIKVNAQTGDVEVVQKELNALNKTVSNLDGNMETLTDRLKTMGHYAIGALALNSAFNMLYLNSVNLNSKMEDLTIGIASVINASSQDISMFGNALDSATKFNMSMFEAKEALDYLKIANLETTATLADLAEVFKIALSPALSYGMSIKETVTFVKELSNAGSALGLDTAMLSQELRAIFAGEINSDSLINQMLKITKEQLELWKEQGTVAENLSLKLKDYSASGEALANSWSGLLSNSSDLIDGISKQAGEDIFAFLKEDLKSLNHYLTTNGNDIAETLGGAFNVSYLIAKASFEGITGSGAILWNSLIMVSDRILYAFTSAWEQIYTSYNYYVTGGIYRGLENLNSILPDMAKIDTSSFLKEYNDGLKKSLELKKEVVDITKRHRELELKNAEIAVKMERNVDNLIKSYANLGIKKAEIANQDKLIAKDISTVDNKELEKAKAEAEKLLKAKEEDYKKYLDKLDDLEDEWLSEQIAKKAKAKEQELKDFDNFNKELKELDVEFFEYREALREEDLKKAKEAKEKELEEFNNLFDNINKALDEQFFDVMSGKFDNFGDWLKDFSSSIFDGVVRGASKSLADSITATAKDTLINQGVTSLTGAIGGTAIGSSLGIGTSLGFSGAFGLGTELGATQGLASWGASGGAAYNLGALAVNPATWGVLAAGALIYGLTTSKKKITGSGLEVREDGDINSYKDYKKKNGFGITTKKGTDRQELSFEAQKEIDTLFNSYEQFLVRFDDSIKDIKVAAGKYKDNALFDIELPKAFLKELTDSNYEDEIYTIWADYAKSINSTVQQALGTVLANVDNSLNKIDRYFAEDKDLFDLDILRQNVEKFKEQAGLFNVNLTNLKDEILKTVNETADPTRLNNLNVLTDLLIELDTKEQDYRATLGNSVAKMVDYSAQLKQSSLELEKILNPNVLNFDYGKVDLTQAGLKDTNIDNWKQWLSDTFNYFGKQLESGKISLEDYNKSISDNTTIYNSAIRNIEQLQIEEEQKQKELLQAQLKQEEDRLKTQSQAQEERLKQEQDYLEELEDIRDRELEARGNYLSDMMEANSNYLKSQKSLANSINSLFSSISGFRASLDISQYSPLQTSTKLNITESLIDSQIRDYQALLKAGDIESAKEAFNKIQDYSNSYLENAKKSQYSSQYEETYNQIQSKLSTVENLILPDYLKIIAQNTNNLESMKINGIEAVIKVNDADKTTIEYLAVNGVAITIGQGYEETVRELAQGFKWNIDQNVINSLQSEYGWSDGLTQYITDKLNSNYNWTPNQTEINYMQSKYSWSPSQDVINQLKSAYSWNIPDWNTVKNLANAQFDWNKNGIPEFAKAVDSSGNIRLTYDLNEDSQPDLTFIFDPNGRLLNIEKNTLDTATALGKAYVGSATAQSIEQDIATVQNFNGFSADVKSGYKTLMTTWKDIISDKFITQTENDNILQILDVFKGIITAPNSGVNNPMSWLTNAYDVIFSGGSRVATTQSNVAIQEIAKTTNSSANNPFYTTNTPVTQAEIVQRAETIIRANPNIDPSMASLYAMMGYSSGGYTGKGGVNEVAGVVHKGEYVIPAWLTNKVDIEEIEKLRLKGYSSGGLVGGTIKTEDNRDLSDIKSLLKELLSEVKRSRRDLDILAEVA